MPMSQSSQGSNPPPHHSASQYLPLLLAVLFIGTSGPVGRLIPISPVIIICIRSMIALGVLGLTMLLQGKTFWIRDKRKRNYILLSGTLLAGHWVAYFFSLQLSSVALGMLSMFTYPVITVLLEPLYLKRKFKPFQIPVAFLALFGIFIMLPSFDISNADTLGMLLGLLSAFFYAFRNLMVKKYASGEDDISVISHQLAVVILVTFPLLFLMPFSMAVIKSNWHYLLFLGVVTTALGHRFFVKSLRFFSASTVSILSNFTPVVGILLGIILLDEKPSLNILIGGSLILLTAFIEIWLGKNNSRPNPEGL